MEITKLLHRKLITNVLNMNGIWWLTSTPPLQNICPMTTVAKQAMARKTWQAQWYAKACLKLPTWRSIVPIGRKIINEVPRTRPWRARIFGIRLASRSVVSVSASICGWECLFAFRKACVISMRREPRSFYISPRLIYSSISSSESREAMCPLNTEFQ